MFLDPAGYARIPAYDLLAAAAKGYIGLDQRLFHTLVDEPSRTLDGIVRYAADFDENAPVNLEMDLIAIFRHLRAPEGLPFLTSLARRYPGDVPEDLCDAFRAIGAPAVDPLLELVLDSEDVERSELLFVLGTLGARDPRILTLLSEHLDEDAFEAALALAHYGDPAAVPALEARLARFPERLSDSERFARNEVRAAIETLKQGTAPTAADEHFDIFGDYPQEAGPAFSALNDAECLTFLDCPRPEYRAAAIAELGTRETVGSRADRLFAAAAGDADPVVRGRAWEVLGEVVEDRPDIRKAMLDRLRDSSAPPTERAGALLGLSNEAGDALREYTIALYDLPETRPSALRAMWRSFDRSFADYFRRHIDDSDLEVRRQAITGAGFLGLYSEAGRIQKYLDQEDLRADALFAYALAVPAEISRGRIRALFRRIDATAGSLSLEEKELVESALDQRLAMHGLDPVFAETARGGDAEEEQPVSRPRVGRNDPCPCGSGKKYKKCCGA